MSGARGLAFWKEFNFVLVSIIFLHLIPGPRGALGADHLAALSLGHGPNALVCTRIT